MLDSLHVTKKWIVTASASAASASPPPPPPPPPPLRHLRLRRRLGKPQLRHQAQPQRGKVMRRGAAGGGTDTGLGRAGSQDGSQKRRCTLFLFPFYQFFDSQCTAPHLLKLFPPSQSIPTKQLRKTAPLALPTGNSARKSVPSASPARNSARRTVPLALPTDNLAGAEFLTGALLAHTSSSKLPVLFCSLLSFKQSSK
jgi:hypothetical protein